jgi:hypothetical protein
MAGFSSSSGYLDTLISNSADAQSNLYLLNITTEKSAPSDGIDKIRDDLRIRTESFDWTPPSQDAYDVKFLTAKINRPTSFVKVTHNFSFTVRVDSQYEVYKALLAQQKITFNPKQHWALNDINEVGDKLFNLNVAVITGATTSYSSPFKYLVGFNGCWITAIEPIAFKTGEPGPVKVKISCAFKKLVDTDTPANDVWLGYEK